MMKDALAYHPREFYKCQTPIAMEVWDKTTDKMFIQSTNFNGDGHPTAEKFNLWEGFQCTAGAQPQTIETIPCPDVKAG